MPDVHPWRLSPRELQAVRLLIPYAGSQKEIARDMKISVKCVESHLMNARRKAGVRNTFMLAIEFDRLMRPTVMRHKL